MQVAAVPASKPFETGRNEARFLYVVVDSDGMYFGANRTNPKAAISVLEALLSKENIKNVFVCGTSTARHGDFVSFWGNINRETYFVAPLSRIARRPGYRLPLTGIFRHFEGWEDKETGEYLEYR